MLMIGQRRVFPLRAHCPRWRHLQQLRRGRSVPVYTRLAVELLQRISLVFDRQESLVGRGVGG
jgi:hypothetical protein